jgi:uncharacterized protein with HEPN domain
MRDTKDDRLYVVHILECIEKIDPYTAGGQGVFLTTDIIQDAVMRNLQVMAESTQRLSLAIRAQYPGIDWRQISRFRNVVVHDYLRLDYHLIWTIIKSYLEPLERAMSDALANLDSLPESAD